MTSSPTADTGYEEYLKHLEEDYQRSLSRRGQERPHSWGDPLPNEEELSGYFCNPCWDSGELTGFHPYDQPPCDSPARRDF